MNWKKETENELRDYLQKRKALINIPDIIKDIDYELTLLRNNSSGYDKCTWNDLYIENVIKKKELERNLMLTKQRIKLIESGLCGISSDERRLLELFYIDHQEEHVKTLADELGREKSCIYNKKDSALRKFTLAMYGVEELRDNAINKITIRKG